MRRCTRCVLPETFPGVDFDGEGVCSVCRSAKAPDRVEASKRKYRERFETLLAEHRGRSGYDCLMAYSGGKDSTYTLLLLRRRYGLSVLALTMDNGFVSPAALDNIRTVAEGLGVDHVLFKPRFDLLKTIFRTAAVSEMYPPKTLERASTICTSCMGIVKFAVLRTSIEGAIPFTVYGWSPGQAPIEASIFKNNPPMIKSMQRLLLEPMRRAAGADVERYFLTERHFDRSAQFPYSVSPLAFLDYNEDEILETIAGLGWRKPDDTDPNSTNCLLNAFGNKVHRERFAFHPYAFELSGLVREGHLDRAEAIARLETAEDEAIVQRVRDRLGID
jgi:tRNA(Ile)-lysidine synthase TilS/MesJ